MEKLGRFKTIGEISKNFVEITKNLWTDWLMKKI